MGARSGGPKTAGEGGGHLNSMSSLDAAAPWIFHFRGHGVSGSSSYILFGMGPPCQHRYERATEATAAAAINEWGFAIGEEGPALTCPVVARSFVEC